MYVPRMRFDDCRREGKQRAPSDERRKMSDEQTVHPCWFEHIDCYKAKIPDCTHLRTTARLSSLLFTGPRP